MAEEFVSRASRGITDSFFQVDLSIENRERLDEILAVDENLKKRIEELFLDVVFQVHKYLVRITALDTGELRGGWLGILKKYNQDYSRSIRDTKSAMGYVGTDYFKARNKTPYFREYHFSDAEVEKGAAQSFFEDLPMDVTVVNAVPHASYMEFGVPSKGIEARYSVDFARYKGEFWFNKVFEQYFEQVAEAEGIVAPDDQSNNEIPS